MFTSLPASVFLSILIFSSCSSGFPCSVWAISFIVFPHVKTCQSSEFCALSVESFTHLIRRMDHTVGTAAVMHRVMYRAGGGFLRYAPFRHVGVALGEGQVLCAGLAGALWYTVSVSGRVEECTVKYGLSPREIPRAQAILCRMSWLES